MKICLLCKNNHVSEIRSHIVPKFLGKDLISNNDIQIFDLINSKSYTQSDLYVEFMILCKECENKLNTVETVSKRVLDSIYKQESNQWFDVQKDGSDAHRLILKKNMEFFHLFLLSIMWRISMSKYFVNFKLPFVFEEQIREILLLNLKAKQRDYKVFKNVIFDDFCYLIIKPHNKGEESRGNISAYAGNDKIFVINLPYISLVIYLNNSVLHFVKDFCNTQLDSVQILSVEDRFYKDMVFANLNK